jgi:Flp pilus assembly protein TadD
VVREIRKSRAAAKKKAQSAASGAKNRRGVLAAGAILFLATVAAYHNSLGGPFIFDDLGAIVPNPTIHQLWPIGKVLSPPGGGDTVGGRPILNLSLAVNYAISQTGVRSYHIVNLAIHILAGLALLGIVRRTLLLESMKGAMLLSSPRHASVPTDARRGEDGSMARGFGPSAPYLAGAIAMLWMIHPLQTESVTYIVQRAESLMGLFYLLTLYCVIRSSSSRPVLWSLAAVAACAMGMGTKEVMVTAPVIVLLYDRTFLSGSFVGALRKRWGLYAGLVACWGLLAYLMSTNGDRGGTAGFGARDVADWRSYAQAEFAAILHYLRLSFWPDALCLDYGISTARALPDVLAGAAAVGLLAIATVWGLLRGRKWGFLGAWFLVILAPTSSVVPLRDPIFEHRMYLSLAAVAAAAVIGGFLLWRKLIQIKPSLRDRPVSTQWAAPGIVLAVATVVLGGLTLARNNDYKTSLAIWQDTANKSPTNARAQCSLGMALCEESMVSSGIERLRESIRLDPKCYLAYSDLAQKLYEQGKFEESSKQFREGIRIEPRDVYMHLHLGLALFHLGKFDEAIGEFREEIRLDPQNAEAHNSLGQVLAGLGKLEEALAEYREAVRIKPRFAQAHANLARALEKLGRNEEAAEARIRAAALESGAGR